MQRVPTSRLLTVNVLEGNLLFLFAFSIFGCKDVHVHFAYDYEHHVSSRVCSTACILSKSVSQPKPGSGVFFGGGE